MVRPVVATREADQETGELPEVMPAAIAATTAGDQPPRMGHELTSL
jgi:hypothetical protein